MDVLRRLALAALVDAVPVAAVDAALDASGRTGQRVRTLPPWVTAYHVLAAAMDPSAGYDDVTALLWSTLPAATGRRLARQAPSRGAVTRARSRLGVEPFRELLGFLVDAVPPAAVTSRIYLQKVRYGQVVLWWACDAGAGGLRGCAFDPSAALGLVRPVGTTAVVLCPPYDDSSQELLVQLGASGTVAVGELPERFAGPWASPRGRSEAAAKQEILARACVQVAQELAFGGAGAAP